MYHVILKCKHNHCVLLIKLNISVIWCTVVSINMLTEIVFQFIQSISNTENVIGSSQTALHIWQCIWMGVKIKHWKWHSPFWFDLIFLFRLCRYSWLLQWWKYWKIQKKRLLIDFWVFAEVIWLRLWLWRNFLSGL